MRVENEYVFFWGDKPFSNFTPCPNLNYLGINWKSTEQAFMWIKAVEFKDYKTAQKMIRLAMKAFIEAETHLKDDLMELEDSIHIMQSKAINLIATQMAESSFDEKERSNYFIYLFRVIKAFDRIGDISVEMMDVAVEFHENIPRPTTPRSFRY